MCESHTLGEMGVYAQQKGWGWGGPGFQLTCRMGVSLSSAPHSSSRRVLGHGRGNSGSSAAGPGLSRVLHAVPASGLPRSLLSQSTSPSAALMLFQHNLAALPASSWAGCVLSSFLPPSAHPEEQHFLFYTIGLDLRVLLPPFSPASQPCPYFKNSSVCHLFPTSQDKSPQAKARVSICT